MIVGKDLNVDQIKKLWILDLIVQTGSLKKASLKAKVTPSAVSQSLTQLEEIVGKPLLIRNKNSVIATTEAEAILNIVRPAFDVFEKIKNLNNVEAPHISWINFGTYESVAVDILPGLIEVFRTQMPKTKLGLRIARTQELINMVRKGELCAALITEVDDLNRLHVEPIYTDELGFFVNPSMPIAKLGWAAVEKFGYGTISPPKIGYPRYYSRFIKQMKGLKPIVRSESFEALRAAAVSGSIISVLPQRVGKRKNDLVQISPPEKSYDKGEHRLLMIGTLNCDKEELSFLAKQCKKFL